MRGDLLRPVLYVLSCKPIEAFPLTSSRHLPPNLLSMKFNYESHWEMFHQSCRFKVDYATALVTYAKAKQRNDQFRSEWTGVIDPWWRRGAWKSGRWGGREEGSGSTDGKPWKRSIDSLACSFFHSCFRFMLESKCVSCFSDSRGQVTFIRFLQHIKRCGFRMSLQSSSSSSSSSTPISRGTSQ